jgi:hypothetical protein
VFQSFANDFDDDDYRPELADEWLNPTEFQRRVTDREAERNRVLNSLTTQAQRNNNNNSSDNRRMATNDNRATMPAPIERTIDPLSTPITTTMEADEPVPNVNKPSPVPGAAPETTINQPQERRYPERNRKPTKRLIEDDEFGMYSASREWIFMGKALINRWRTTQTDYRYIVALLTSVETLGHEGIHPAIAQFPSALKASKKDPDSPSFQEAMT